MENKRGLFSFIFGLVGLFVLIMILTILIPIQTGGVEPDKIYSTLNNVSNKTLNSFKIQESNGVIVNVGYSFINFILYSSLEVVKAGVKYAIENPSFVNARTLLWIVLISLLAPILYYLFLGFIVIFLLIREGYLIRKERRK